MPLNPFARLIPVTTGGISDTTPDFSAAARAVLDYLHKKMGFDLWMVTRTEGNDWIVLQANDHGYGVEPNKVLKWTDSFCSHMVEGRGPRIAPDSDSIPVYANTPIRQQLQIGAYVGVPLTYSDGSLFGTLCAIHPTPRADATEDNLPLIELFAAMLSSLLNAEITATEVARLAERAREDAEIDALTNLYNRRGWDRLLAAEEARCARYATPASVLAIDLDGLKQVNDTRGHAAGDDLLVSAARAISVAVREIDVVARTGGDEFLILATECDAASARALTARVQDHLAEAGIAASIGYATRIPGQGLTKATEAADQAMYEVKSARKARS